MARAENNNMCSVAKDVDKDVDTRRRPLTTEMVLLLENPSKGNNLGSILRCAAASGVRQVRAVGYDKCATQGSHGADKHVKLVAFGTAAQAVAYNDDDDGSVLVIGLLGAFPNGYRQSGYPVVYQQKDNDNKNLAVPLLESPPPDENKSCTLLGTSYPIHVLSSIANDDNNNNPIASIRSARTICIAISKDRLGLPVTLAQQCHVFCHIPCVALFGDSGQGPPLLDCPATLTIALHHLAEKNAGYDEATFRGHKFQVVRPAMSTTAIKQEQLQRRQHREETLHEAAMEMESSATLGSLLWKTVNDGDGSDGDY